MNNLVQSPTTVDTKPKNLITPQAQLADINKQIS